ncbi:MULTISPECIES: bifunctional diaminohydroxyphosphoribosylaminopyrimidine deaminase/5-amino-6-(5-phosphoribosylamino)uracil reductase RibD [unclassified Coleofasciculus]|uniref:bifunctional diaminohydroxyphosphoribosylaminopyrimidine deaminase/5-amino-6-(5-phosphoribosylamino)uracil reductase RibD n=1 Tax=unclassified Coleofasciculus TaxID=2692782 RepID=UPI00187F0CC2|nr:MULTISPECIES: bifunctional diaminohydroxyphosphoribosylaminopyrimidine deaminase/5-amino-6-(5-phosphoribosylamino)uracil reductase RibD [unclassified Coleofasciculus]MBE9125289.1 bifunctional diaminohydroxyphosphoribosylaminopyrimidine deaminase/5-amino-6-(5-phosphoribosylamino)uracil reductase RibD [Coleofasciculus sp. LEGE 07081]MBE9147070.1 bifunctional diaminohydroxyphosphoribosylaminopyrimidine deaminase/5-amino-6-(5-phosphoribosylamino)uracil reductase RibD [Coleofasciculus sp. LEGE 0709
MEHFPVDAQANVQQASSASSRPTPFDHAMMQGCIELARRALGRTTPNPLVGSVIVRDGEIVGEGFHPGAGQPHAEIFALRQAGEKARGATLYVNLEPCNHYGRTPPCSEAVVAAGVAKVVVGMIDPNPLVSSGGIERLKRAGIEVVVGVEAEACRQLNEAFIHRILYHRPFGILKYAMTLDGKIATTSGHSAWVTGQEARTRVHKLRTACDAVIVGGNTVRFDNPHLTSHHPDVPNPLRVVMTRTFNLPMNARIWEIADAPTLVVTEKGVNPDLQQQLANKGVEVLEMTPLTPGKVMAYLYDRQLSTVLWECGGTLAAKAIADGAVQKVLAFIAPKIVGGRLAPSPVGDLGLVTMTDALTLERVSWRQVGPDYALEGYLPLPDDTGRARVNS